MNSMTPNPKAAGMSAQQLDRVTAHLQQNYVDQGKIAGAVTLVYRKGELAYFQPVGKMDIERDKPMQQDTLFRIYSMSKPITSVALMMLYEQGKFQLNDPVHRFIPEFRDLGVYQAGIAPHFLTKPCDRAMTIRDLFTHMSGLTYGFMNRTNVDHGYRKMGVGGVEPGATLQSFVETLGKLPLEFSPGTRWNYSVATDVLGHLVEVISGQKFDAYLKEHIFDPLGMQDTGFMIPKDQTSRFAANYFRGPNKKLALEDDPQDSVYIEPRSFLSGGGGLASSAADYLTFCRMLLGRGELNGVRILGPKTIEMMTKNYLPNNEDLTRWAEGTFSETTYEGYGFGLGFSIHLGAERSATIGSPGEYAWGGAASTIFWVDPVEELIVVFMTQLMPSGTFNFRGQLKSLIYPAIID